MTRKLHPDNNSRLRIRAPAVIDAAMYLDAFQAQGQQVRVVVEVGAFKFEGSTFAHAVEELRKWFLNRSDAAPMNSATSHYEKDGENCRRSSGGGSSATRYVRRGTNET